MNRCVPIWLTAAFLATIAGCAARPTELEFRYSVDEDLQPPREVIEGGDFALFYAGREVPEVPVRVSAGDVLGFVRGEDGRLKAVAGAFVMEVDAEVRAAAWRRLNSNP